MPTPGFSLKPFAGGVGPPLALDWSSGTGVISFSGESYDYASMVSAARETGQPAPMHGSGGAQAQSILAGQRRLEAEEHGELRSAEELGHPRGSTVFQQAQACFEFGQTHDAFVKGPGESDYKRIPIGGLLLLLRPLAGPNAWTCIHRLNGATNFITHGISVQIVKKGAPPPAPFAGLGLRWAESAAAKALRERHAAEAAAAGLRDPSYCFSEIDGGGNVARTSDLLGRQACILLGAEWFPTVAFADYMGAARATKIGISTNNVSFVITRVLGSSGSDEDVLDGTSQDEEHKLFLSQVPDKNNGEKSFAAFLTPEGRELLKNEKGKDLPPGWHHLAGTKQLWTGIKREKSGVDDLTQPFKGKKGCPQHTSVTGNAVSSMSGISGCTYFIAHYYPGDGKEQLIKGAGGKKS